MQSVKKQPAGAERKPAAVQVKSIKAKGGIDVDLKLHDAANETSPAKTPKKAEKKAEPKVKRKALNKPFSKARFPKTEPKETEAKKAKTKNELFAALEERSSTVKYRVWGVAGLMLIVVALLFAQFSGGGEDVAVAPATPAVEAAAPVVEDRGAAPATTLATGDNSEMVTNIIDALRRSNVDAAAGTAAAPVATEQTAAISSLYTLVTGAFAQGQSAAYIDQLLNESLQSGEITVPAALMLPNGRVDTKSVMAMFGAQ